MFLSNPFPTGTSTSATIRFSLLAGLIVFLILYLFRPFNIDGGGHEFTFIDPLIYGLATAVMVFLNSLLLPALFTRWHRESAWTLGKEIIAMCWQVVSIALVNILITHYRFGEPLSASSLLRFLMITAAVGIFPIAFILLIKQQLLYKRFSERAVLLEKEVQFSQPASSSSPPLPEVITLTGDNQGEAFSVSLNDLMFLSAADNYLKISYQEQGKSAVKVIRSTLKKAENSLEEHPNLFRCHRAYIVNLSFVYHISGNAQGYKLHLIGSDEIIPVSRSLNHSIGEHLKRFSQLTGARI